ncbi:ROK family transcriptional regulator [Nonomuraea glycinis]|uniref:ROK family transcriptional regulator n=1 Tax=Nonomuraea glycinis TaxID=2047744 RepID=UPI001662D5E7|nr:ROK family transcriptional regulator [Nonomuraea glycinis]MCA2183051.1 ROK family transcriptional regulator [Nonomuraea glycinis]WSG64034.1 ROK family transcriptional regulator [Nonomuraea glycinis]
MERRPGVPRLLREINDRAALDLLLATGPMTRGQIGELTGLSKVTASQTLARLEERGLVEVVGAQAGGRGPNAALYSVIASSAYVAGLEVGPNLISTAIADINGRTVAEVAVDPTGHDDPVPVVHDAIMKACRTAKVSAAKLRGVVIGTPGVVDPRSGDVRFSFDLPGWHEGIREALAGDLKREVMIENDVNLAAIAEQADGAAQGRGDFVLLWSDRGLGMAVMLGGKLHRGRSGSAGEIGYLPVPGVPLPEDIRTSPGRLPSLAGGLQSLVSAEAVAELARSHGFEVDNAGQSVQVAVAAGAEGEPLLDEIAHRLALGVAAVCVILDPGLVVLAGEVGHAGGEALTSRVEEAVARICPVRPQVVTTAVTDPHPVLRGAVLAALDRARGELLTS